MTERKELSPLELLAKRPSPITDVVYGNDHPGKQPKSAPRVARIDKLDGRSLVRDLVPTKTLQALTALEGRLIAQERRKKR